MNNDEVITNPTIEQIEKALDMLYKNAGNADDLTEGLELCIYDEKHGWRIDYQKLKNGWWQ